MKEYDLQEQLIEDCRNGNRKAQYRLYQMYSRAMYNICVRMVKVEADAEDILQNSFVDVFRNLKNFQSQSTPGAWIKRIVINNCINFLRKKKVHFTELNETIYTVPETDVPDRGEPDYTVQKIRRAMHQLSDGYRMVFSLYAMEGYDHTEIADILGVSVATSKTQYHRAKKKIRMLIHEEIS